MEYRIVYKVHMREYRIEYRFTIFSIPITPWIRKESVWSSKLGLVRGQFYSIDSAKEYIEKIKNGTEQEKDIIYKL